MAFFRVQKGRAERECDPETDRPCLYPPPPLHAVPTVHDRASGHHHQAERQGAGRAHHTARAAGRNMGGRRDGLLACSFCTAVYHNSEACLGEAWVANEALAKSASFPWACPACFKKGVTAVQRAALKPTGQRAAGAKKSRKKRAKKK